MARNNAKQLKSAFPKNGADFTAAISRKDSWDINLFNAALSSQMN